MRELKISCLKRNCRFVSPSTNHPRARRQASALHLSVLWQNLLVGKVAVIIHPDTEDPCVYFSSEFKLACENAYLYPQTMDLTS